MNSPRIKTPFVFTIFGASGDLAKIKLFPALYRLAEQDRLPKDYYIVGFARTKMSNEEFRKEFEQSIKSARGKNIDPKILENLLSRVHYYTGQYDKLSSFQNFKKYLKNLTGSANIMKIAYFSVPPIAFKPIIKNLGESKNSKNEDIRLIVEKPFGTDTKSATELFHFVAQYFGEDQVYLLDHYLGKSAVQSILSLRHSNRLLNVMMKGPEVANIQITAFENLGVHNRVSYFEQVGTIKDMVQSHLLQILALIGMSIPITENADSLHREKNNILSALQFNKSKRNLVIGQYEHYTDKKGVPKNSKVETFAAMRLFIDRESWYKVPIYIRTGKKLYQKKNYMVVEFKKFAFQPNNEEPNRLIIELQPEEKITITLVNKRKGAGGMSQNISISDSLSCEEDDCLPEHSQLILDVLGKKKINFLCFPEIISSWKVSDAISHFIERNKIRPEIYPQASRGPKSQNRLTEIDGFKWYEL